MTAATGTIERGGMDSVRKLFRDQPIIPLTVLLVGLVAVIGCGLLVVGRCLAVVGEIGPVALEGGQVEAAVERAVGIAGRRIGMVALARGRGQRRRRQHQAAKTGQQDRTRNNHSRPPGSDATMLRRSGRDAIV
jgi:hypothetical protein